jgi:coenzyme F420-reducing hydrogenase alpha subunit
MHDINFDLSIDEISKIEGAASLEIKVKSGQIENLKFSISEWKRFYTQAIKGKPVAAIPQLVDRICGTCSNAHLLASIEAIEKAFGIIPSPQTTLLRKLLYYGLIIRDHALHLYVFSLPDIFGKSSILDFSEDNPLEHELLEDTFAVKEAGNQLAIIVGGRSVHAPAPTIGGFLKLPKVEDLKDFKSQLLSIRPKILKLCKLYAQSSYDFKLKSPLTFTALHSKDFSFLEGTVKTCDSTEAGIGAVCRFIDEKDLGNHLEGVIIPYSHARGFKFAGSLMMVGALARLNIAKDSLHPLTKEAANDYLKLFPSNNLFHNNLAQAIEILHAVDAGAEIIDSLSQINPEPLPKVIPKEAVGVGVIEAPRGTLYYELVTNSDGTVKKGEIIVPTGQNQIVMEKAIYELVEKMLAENKTQEEIVVEIEKLIRAFDPCMSCAAHFLKVKWR